MVKNVYSITLKCKYCHKYDGGNFEEKYNIIAMTSARAVRRALSIAKKDSNNNGAPFRVLDVTNITLVAQDARA